MNVMTPTQMPLGALDVDSVMVLKSHLFTLIIVLLVILTIVKWVLPKLIAAYNRKLDIEEQRLNSDSKLLQESFEKLVTGQEKLNVAIIDQFNNLNKSMTEMRDIFISSLKTGLEILVLFLVVNSSACDSDQITIYQFRPKEVRTEVRTTQKAPDRVEVLDKETQADEPKSCPGGCNPPKTKCNTKNGKCEGSALQNRQNYTPETSDLNFYTEKYGAIDKGIPQWHQ